MKIQWYEIRYMAWKDTVIIPIYHKGDRAECGSYRGVTSLDVTYKIFATSKYDWNDTQKKVQINYQRGFEKIARNIKANPSVVCILFIDFKRLYDLEEDQKCLTCTRKLTKVIV